MDGPDPRAIIDAALAEAERMRATCQRAAPGSEVRMRLDQFRTLAWLLSTAAEAARFRDDGFGDEVDGFRLWVPLRQVEAALDRDRARGAF